MLRIATSDAGTYVCTQNASAQIHCCEKAMLAYNHTYEQLLEVERKRLIRPRIYSCEELPTTSWTSLAIVPKDVVHDAQDQQAPQSARGPREKKKIRQKGSLTARGASERRDHDTNYLQVHQDPATSTHMKGGGVPGLPLLPPAPTDWLITPRSLPSSRIAQKMISTVQKLGGSVLEANKSPTGKKFMPRGLPSVVVDGDLIRQMHEQNLAV